MTVMTAPRVEGCALCAGTGGRLVFQGRRLRVIHAAEAGFPAFYRVIWQVHVVEWSDLAPAERALCSEALAVVEQSLREALAPTKMNLATLGNVVAHLHWHVIARFDWDSRFPAPVWAAPQRTPASERLAAVEARLPALERDMIGRLEQGDF